MISTKRKQKKNNWKLVNKKTNSNYRVTAENNFKHIFHINKIESILVHSCSPRLAICGITPLTKQTRQRSNSRIWRVVFHKWTNWQFPLFLSLALSHKQSHTQKERERVSQTHTHTHTHTHTDTQTHTHILSLSLTHIRTVFFNAFLLCAAVKIENLFIDFVPSYFRWKINLLHKNSINTTLSINSMR